MDFEVRGSAGDPMEILYRLGCCRSLLLTISGAMRPDERQARALYGIADLLEGICKDFADDLDALAAQEPDGNSAGEE